MYISIAVLGVISSLATLFVNVNSTISIKWLLALTFVFLTVVILLARALVVVANLHRFSEPIRVIKSIPEKGILLLRADHDLTINLLLGVFVTHNGYEEIYALGYVENVQDKHVASLRIIQSCLEFPEGIDLVKAAVIKPTLPYTAVYIK